MLNASYVKSLLLSGLIPKTRRCRNSHSMTLQLPSASIEAYKCSFFPRLSGTGMTSLTLRFPPMKCQMIVCASSLHSCVLGTNFSLIRPPPPGEIISFGVSWILLDYHVHKWDFDQRFDLFLKYQTAKKCRYLDNKMPSWPVKCLLDI